MFSLSISKYTSPIWNSTHIFTFLLLLLFSCQVMYDSLLSHRFQHTQFACPSQSPRVCSDSCPLSWWCYLVISSSASLFLCLQQASGSFPMSQLFPSSSQSIGASASVLPINLQCWFSLELTGLISLLSKGLSESSPTPQFEEINSLVLSFLYGPTLTSLHDYWKLLIYTWISILTLALAASPP